MSSNLLLSLSLNNCRCSFLVTHQICHLKRRSLDKVKEKNPSTAQ